MPWDDRLLALFEDLEQQAEGLALSDRDVEVAERGRAEYSRVDLAARLHGSVGRRLAVEVTGLGRLDVVLRRVGSDWCLAIDDRQEWLLRFAAMTGLRGLSDRALSEPVRSVAGRLGLGSALRGVAEEDLPVTVHRVPSGAIRGRLRRIGADFCELLLDVEGPGDYRGAPDSHRDGPPESVEVVPFAAVAALRRTASPS
jgi:hypothetical protein